MLKSIILGHLTRCDDIPAPTICEIAADIKRPIWEVRDALKVLLASGDVRRLGKDWGGFRLTD